MTFKDQLRKIKENWLLIVLVLIIVAFFNLGGTTQLGSQFGAPSFGKASTESLVASRGFYPTPINQGGFAPNTQDRKIIKTAYLSSEVERGTFKDADAKLRNIVTSTDSFLLNENVQIIETGIKGYYQGTYEIKVDTKKYDSVSSQLKLIGEVKSFSENANDITGSFTDLKDELAAEQQRLQQYKDLLSQAQSTQEKLDLTDRIFQQERTVKSLEDALNNFDQQITYSTISVTITEKQSGYANIEFVKFSELITNLVDSINSVLSLIFFLIPYAIAVWVIWFIVRIIKRRR